MTKNKILLSWKKMKKVNAICHRMRDINLIMNVLSGDKDTGNYQSFSHEISCIRKTVKNI